MRRLRNLWCSHKKYCTTTTTTTHSLRGRTPLSGYPNSSFSEFDRTAFTSTPIRYGRSRTLDDVQANDVRYLTRYLSDLSLDRLVDSDEDSQKACFVFREELATLQRQVDSLGRSLQSPSITAPPTSSYQAPSSHAAASLRTNEHTPANTGRDYTRDDPTRNTEVSGESPNSNIREDRIDSDDGQRLESISNALIDNQKSNSDQIGVSKDSEQIGFDVSAHENNAFVDEIEKKYDDSANEQISHSGISLETQNVENSDTHNVQNENQEQYNQNYENNESNYQEMENQQYDQGNYDQNYENSDPQYQEQEYQQHYDPNQEYVQEQYDGQYEQYPDQNYAQPQYDTSAQNYENYNNDGSYQQQQSQEYPPEASQYTDDQKDLDHTEKQRSNSPSAEVPHES
ncbi:hypothetical protein EVAR_99559_1 [Eumeta japonica]|uniref:Uncharacterized protein n=1 Tax=Eumeta variegata TaxID=151549 RepID=A0A4C1YSS7_EUMVA|nr:hypothetical protein EVAR_99559_1 [Eumeta japonica]